MLLLLTVALQALFVYVASGGSCFRMRLENGHCHELIERDTSTRLECCRRGGFYHDGKLSSSVFVRDILLSKSGVPNCKNPCGGEETCTNVRCNKEFECKLIKGKSYCACKNTCSEEDYTSGPVCSSDFRMFRNRCALIKERCRSLNSLFTEIPCPPAARSCNFNADPFDNKPVKVCPEGKVCVMRAYSGKTSCESPDQTGLSYKYSYYKGPICGADNKTYDDIYALRNASLQRGIEIRIGYMGICRGKNKCQSSRMTCRPHVMTGQPICLDCNDLPPNCNAVGAFFVRRTDYAILALNESMKESRLVFGDPRWHGKVFTGGWPGICGSNGQSFPNTCFQQVFSCYGKHYYDLVSSGYCLAG
nr:follistatin [Hymenolepis microstoma]